MKTRINKILIVAGLTVAAFTSSCINDLNTEPIDPNVLTAKVVFDNPESYDQFLNKIYGGMAVSGNAPSDDKQDVVGIDGGSQASFLRALWNLQQLPTEEAMCNWNDQTIQSFHFLNWTSSDVFIKGFYYRLYYQVTLASEFLRETTDEKLDERGLSDAWKAKVKQYRAEARFLRALTYYYVLDLFRNGPMVTEATPIGSTPPPFAKGAEIFSFIESELIAIEADLIDPMVGHDATNYGRASKAAAWTLLAKLYLNAQVYIGEDKNAECLANCEKVFNAGYELEKVYANMFKADNYNSKEMILPIVYDKDKTQTSGGMMFLMASAVKNGDETQARTGAPGAWAGNRATVDLWNKFKHMSDSRAGLLHTGYRSKDGSDLLNITDLTNYEHGVQVLKYSNLNSDGTNSGGSYPNTDFPLMRLADVYLMYAEAHLRGGGGTIDMALGYVNALRVRALSNTVNSIDLPMILDERSRELYWEAVRRTDLIRFGKLTDSDYLWQWKGGLYDGRGVDAKYNIYPIPSADISANKNLSQNPGY